ncbi:hypothetical protein M885DRAFT_520446 [Pelagophyceae sp. CCMP2097]|nr:hypothetical protein M885DRAFT_520446 [Pelagophyceae sp. CCMP2097]
MAEREPKKARMADGARGGEPAPKGARIDDAVDAPVAAAPDAADAPAADAAASAACAGAASSEASSRGDIAPGLVVEVLWEVANMEEDDEVQLVWWNATVLKKGEPHLIQDDDENGVARDAEHVETWTIRYAPRPELSEPDTADADVCFLSRRALLDVESQSIMQWRPDGCDDEVEDDLAAEVEGASAAAAAADATESAAAALLDPAAVAAALEGHVDAAVALAVKGVQARFDALPRDRQCAVADVVLKAKERLKAALTLHIQNKSSEDGFKVITKDDIAAVMQSLQASPDFA